MTSEARICLSANILNEYEEVISRGKFLKITGFKERAQDFITKIKVIALFFETREVIEFLPDKDDNMFLELALAAEAKYLVSGNTSDFNIKEFRGITIVTPKEFYEDWATKK